MDETNFNLWRPHIEKLLPYMIDRKPEKQLSIVRQEDVSQALLLAASTPVIGGNNHLSLNSLGFPDP